MTGHGEEADLAGTISFLGQSCAEAMRLYLKVQSKVCVWTITAQVSDPGRSRVPCPKFLA